MGKKMKRILICSGIILLCVFLSMVWRINRINNNKKVFESQISQLKNYSMATDGGNLELCYEGIILNSSDFYNMLIPYEDRENQRLVNQVAGFINGLGFELSDFSVELYLKTEDDQYVECITYYNEAWYCIKMDMGDGSVDIEPYSRLEVNNADNCVVYKIVSNKKEKILFKLIEAEDNR